MKAKTAPDGSALIAFLVAIGGVVAAFSYTTQFMARSFGYAVALGRPLHGHIYQPLASFMWLAQLDSRCAIAVLRRSRCEPSTLAFLRNAHNVLGGGLLLTAVVVLSVLLVGTIVRSQRTAQTRRRAPQGVLVDETLPLGVRPIVLELGRSTGRLMDLGHGAAVTKGHMLRLVGDDAAQNIVVYGGIGSGKTTRMMNRLARQALQQGCGMLVFSVKSDYGETFIAIARSVGRNVTRIGIDALPFNLLEGVTPEIAASYLKSALLLAGNVSAESVFWNELATELARNALGVLEHIPEHYSLYGLYQYIFLRAFRDELEPTVNFVYARLRETDPAAAERLERYADYESSVFDGFDEKVKAGVRAQLSQVLTPFTLPALQYAFCTARPNNVAMESVLDGTIFLLDLPLSTFGLGAKTIYTLVKLRFFNTMERRRTEKAWDRTRPVVFMCDEYQEIVSVAKGALSDLNFWDKSRDAKCVGIISAQGFSSFKAVIGDYALTAALLQNFRQNIVFRTEDEETIKRATFLMGQVEVERENSSRTKSRSSTTGRVTRSASEGAQVNRQMQSTINPQLFRQLGVGEALAILSIGGGAYDDVITTEPLYVDAAAEVAHA